MITPPSPGNQGLRGAVRQHLARLFATGLVLSCITFAQRADAQREPWIIEEDLDSLTLTPDTIKLAGELFGPYLTERCHDETPSVVRVSVVQLSNGTTRVEAVVSGVSAITPGVYLDNDRTIAMSHVGGGRYLWTGTLPEGQYRLTVYDPCTSAWLVLTTGDNSCDPDDVVGVTEQFLRDYVAWARSENRPAFISFLNGLAYLTPTQRWELFQRTAMDCDAVGFTLIDGFIPTTHDTYLSECDCQSVLIAKAVSAERVRIFDESPVDTSETSFTNNGKKGEFRYSYLEVEGGASKQHMVQITDRKGGDSEKDYPRGDSLRHSTILATLMCNFGEVSPEDPPCYCQKRVDASYMYQGHYELHVDDRKASREKWGSAFVAEGAYFAVQHDDGPFAVQDILLESGARTWGRSVNGDWWSNAIAFFGAVAGAGLVITDSTATTVNQQDAVASVTIALDNWVQTNFAIWTGGIGVTSQAYGIDSTYRTYLYPNEPVSFRIGSWDAIRVTGKRSYNSRAEVHSAHALSLYVHSNNEDIGDEGCCSQHGGAYISKTLDFAVSRAQVEAPVRSFFVARGWPVADFPAGMPEANGFRRDNSRDPGCNDVVVQALRLSEPPTVIEVFDLMGRTLLATSPTEAQSAFGALPDGVYLLRGGAAAELITVTGGRLRSRSEILQR